MAGVSQSEHTKIESYAGQLTDAEQMERHLIPLEAELAGLLPQDRTYRLAVGLGFVADKMLEPDLVRAALRPWIIEKAPTLIAGTPASAPRHQVIGRQDELPVEVTLSAWPLAIVAARCSYFDRCPAMRTQ